MKKFFSAIFTALFCTFAFAGTGYGGQCSLKLSSSACIEAGINFRSDFSPWGIAANFDFNGSAVDVVVDNWWIYKRINSMVNWFALWGLSFSGKFENECHAKTGSRIGFGMNVFLFENRSVEFFSHVAWNPSIGIKFGDEVKTGFIFKPASFPVDVGARFWL